VKLHNQSNPLTPGMRHGNKERTSGGTYGDID
jgi:hypothetical protein